MSGTILDYYIYAFSNLSLGGGKIKEKAPHKPILLLSIIQAYESKLLTTNQIPVSPELTGIVKTNWNLFVTTNHTLSRSRSFTSKNEKGNWWELIANPG